MKACDDKDRAVRGAKEDGVGKSTQQRATDVPKHDRELVRVLRNGLNRNIKGRAEAGTQPGDFLFVSVLRLDSLALRRRKEDDVPLQGERRASCSLSCSHETPSARS